MKDNRAFILSEDKTEEFLSKPKNKPRTMNEEANENIKPLGEELRKVREGITDEKVLIGYNMAIAICNKYFKAESEDKE